MAKKKSQGQRFTFTTPVVTVLGHVDHGKTTLLDAIRKTNIAAREAGGITQRIGAYSVQVGQNTKLKELRTITFIDTPGHEAFAKMRSRGASVSDIAILVVAANDGVMPQTKESIQHIKSAKIPYIVAATKIDLAEANLEKMKQQLTKADVKLEEYGGDVPLVPISAKTGKGIDKLLEMILLIAELAEIKADGNGQFKGVVIEAGLDKGKGPVITLIVKSGSLKKGDSIVTSEGNEAKVRVMFDEFGKEVTMAIPGKPVELLGLSKVPDVGTIIYRKDQEVIEIAPQKKLEIPPKTVALEIPPAEEIAVQKLKIVLKTDNVGSLEAIGESIKSKENVTIIASGTGSISESDVMLAKSSGAIIIGFGVKPPQQVVKLAQSEKVMMKLYTIIYEMLEEIDEVAEALQSGGLEEVLGEGRIIAIFEMKGEKIAGIKVISGRIAKGDKVKIVRENKEIGRTKIKSLRHGKEDITKAEQGSEAGASMAQKLDFLANDSIIAIG